MSNQSNKFKAESFLNGIIQFFTKNQPEEKELRGSVTCNNQDGCDYRIITIYTCGFGTVKYGNKTILYIWNEQWVLSVELEERK